MNSLHALVREYWHFGCHASELVTEGDYVKFELLEETVVLYHDGQRVIAFDNLCPHRGARFFDEFNGNSRATCKYHGWTHSRGQLLAGSFSEEGSCSRRLNQYSVETCGSFIFFAIAPRQSLRGQLSDALYEAIEEISFDAAHRTDINTYTYKCNWAVAVENALEPDHVPFVHSETLGKLDLTNCKNEFFSANSVVTFDVGNARLRKGLEQASKYFLTGNQKYEGYRSIHLFPFGFISSTHGLSYSIQNFFPRTSEETHFSSRLYFPEVSNPKYLPLVNDFMLSSAQTNHMVFEEDHDICARISHAAWRKHFDSPLTASEEKIQHFRRHIAP